MIGSALASRAMADAARRDLAAAWGGPAPAARQTEMTIARDRPRRVIVRKP